MDTQIPWTAKDYEIITDHEGNTIVKRSDGASIPTDPRNVDYYEFLQVEKSDKKNEIKRTTIPAPKAEEDPLLARITSLEKDIATIKSSLKLI